MLIIDSDGTRVSRLPPSQLSSHPSGGPSGGPGVGGGWVVEFDGSASGLGPLSTLLGNSRGEIEVQAAPGVILSSFLGGGVACRLPDGSKFLAQLPAATYVPSSALSHGPTSESLRSALDEIQREIEAKEIAQEQQGQPSAEGEGQGEGQAAEGTEAAPPAAPEAVAEEFDLSCALSSRHEFSSCIVLDLLTGRAALTPNASARDQGLAFKVGPHLSSVDFWPQPQATEWLEYPPGSTPEEVEAAHAAAVAEAVENDLPPPAAPEPPAPIKRAVPIAQSITPRIFAIFPAASGGGGYEILEPHALHQ